MAKKLTPMMQQYFSIKNKYEDAILLFRLGDFYEMFADDAKLAAKELELTLTSRNKGKGKKTPMAGIPYHSTESYIATLIEKGYRVAICEQVEDPSEASGLVKREVVRVITPGTVIDNEFLDDKSNNYLATVTAGKNVFGFAIVDISTGEFTVTELSGKRAAANLIDELARINPAECLIDPQIYQESEIVTYIKQQIDPILNDIDERFNYRQAYDLLTDHFNVSSLEGFGCEGLDLAIEAAGATLDFLIETQKRTLNHLNQLSTYSTQDYMVLDANTRRNLELTKTIRDQDYKGSLLWVLDQTVTAMGGRKLRKWIEQPLLKPEEINGRLDAVNEIKDNIFLKEELKELLDQVYDIERLIGKVTYGSANARDLIALKSSINVLPKVEELLNNFSVPKLQDLKGKLDILEDVHSLIEQSIQEEPPVTVREGGLIKMGYDEELDEFKKAMTEGKDWITNLEQQEKERTGIKSLKVGFNKVHGYYIEVTKANIDLVPDNYERKQTLSNSERYITPELKEKEAKILGAEEKSVELEYQLFTGIRDKVGNETKRIQKVADILARLDVIVSLAEVALNNDYSRPAVNASDVIEIEAGRHPVVEEMLEEENFVPNDTYADCDQDRFLIVTGPNMSGKSTYMRQVALITLMAQIGSFFPAKNAEIGIVDRIFTRVGASDDLTTGQSTFMVEMNEVANILNNATKNSLIILDEVGRGTSTYDGLSIAWAVTEYISNPNNIGAKSLFATHYHELTELESKLAGVKNYNVAVKEEGDDIAFLRKIIPGRANDSYGIEVAKLAGVPNPVIKRANQILDKLESESDNYQRVNEDEPVERIKESKNEEIVKDNKQKKDNLTQLALFNPQNAEFLKELSDLDIMSMTPLEAMNKLHQLQQEAKEELNKDELA
ncbi:DNA mismatch repair protein MutS [Selenihalanaerobacter shriftii]|uniref:DNA mismatch repair protein MutS n=2 Tax=Selenihalanaerobacter shriftii TaxID=142842 RepID=A0A1T4M0D3_9FIRM|nr:DNA mismatch repair protein MutS [Selenihalanaerobacter shriftii]SJZ60361.1 DNA mismatch repair protein MutS [Selenihalanaerobacter shriftii]